MRRTSKAKGTLDIIHSNMGKQMKATLLHGERILRLGVGEDVSLKDLKALSKN